jgi:multiple sugar transport system substrate-binding protein
MLSLRDEVQRVVKLKDNLRRGEIDRREFMMLTATTSALAFLAACSFGGSNSPSTGSSTSGQITVPVYTTENDPGTLSFLTAAGVAYQKDHPNVSTPFNLVSDQLADTFINNAFRSKHDVGIFSPNVRDIVGWAQSGYLLELDSLIKTVGADDFFSGTRVTYNGHDYSMPWQKSVSVCFYRTDVLQSLGITPPTNVDDWINILKEVHGRNGMIGMATGVGSDTPEFGLWCMHPFVQQSGYGYFDKNGTLTYNQPAVFDGLMKFVTILKNYSSKDFMNATFGDPLNAFVAGKAVFAHYTGRIAANVWQSAPNLKGKIDVLSVEPAGKFMTGKIGMTFPKGYCIYKGTQSPDTAIDYLKFITTGDNAVSYALTVPGQPMPPLKSVLAKFLDPTNATVKGNALMSDPNFFKIVKGLGGFIDTATSEETMMGSVNNGQFAPISNVNPFTGLIWKTNPPDSTWVQQVILNGADPQTAWKQASTTMDTIAKTWLSQNKSWKPTG